MANKKEIAAVKKTRDQWRWLADNPEMGKEDYFNDVIKLPREKRPLNRCWLCQIWLADFGICKGCPLGTKKLNCEEDIDNPWNCWCYAQSNENYELVKFHALRIVRACNRWLKKNV